MTRLRYGVAGAIAFGFGGAASACQADPIAFEGEIGRGITLVTGDASPLPRLMFIDEGCPGAAAQGGCPPDGDRRCQPLLIDSLAPLSALRATSEQLRFGRECLEVRQGRGMAAPTPESASFEGAVTRFRFLDLPLVRAPAMGTSQWSWTSGSGDQLIDPYGVLGGNLLRQFAVRFTTPRGRLPRVALFREFPGNEDDLADQGLAFLPLQFPGRLLGRTVADRCDIDGAPCSLGVFDFQGNIDVALLASRMVMDACIAMPPCGLEYVTDPESPFGPGVCEQRRGPAVADETSCIAADEGVLGGAQASLVIATAVPGLVLFGDSARRMFGDPALLPPCEAVSRDTPACLHAQDGRLFMAGWAPAGDTSQGDAPLFRIGVRTLALLPGLRQARGPGACTRARERMEGLLGQCNSFTAAFDAAGSIEDTTPPYSDKDGLASSSLVVLGETRFAQGQTEPDTVRWIETLVIPENHPLPLSVRRDVAPEALEPDGLIGTALMADTISVLDYTDPNPGLRVRCLDPRHGGCLVAPNCSGTAQAACCHGLPSNLLAEFIVTAETDTCCGALSGEELREIQVQGRCRGVAPP